MGSTIEVRGIYFRAVKDAFPYLAEVVGPALSTHFEDVDFDGWYGGAPFFEVIRYFSERISPQAMALIGVRWSEIFKDTIVAKGITTPGKLIEKVPELYRDAVRGEGAGEWAVREYAPGRAVLNEAGVSAGVALTAGVIKAAFETVGAYNVRVTVLDDRAQRAEANRYVVEWLIPGAA